ncbi:MAG: glycosyltransferase family 4 protein [Acidimicrobiales bacterium]
MSAVPRQPVGAGRYTIELAAALGERSDVELVLWARRDDAARWPHESVRPVAPTSRPARLVWEQLRLPALLGGAGADVHHGPHYTLPERARLPLVVTIHDLTFFDHPEWHEPGKVRFFRRAIRRAVRGAQALVCVSDRTAQRLQELLAPAGRIFVAPHGVDHGRFCSEEAETGADDAVLRRLGVVAPYVLFLGTLEPRKAVPTLVHAFARIAASHPEVALVLAGRPGWGADEVRRAIAAASLSERVVLPGYVDDGAVPALLRRAAAVVYPAWEEGFGLPALEALACGAPLVTTVGTPMADVSSGVATLVGPGDADALADALDGVLRGTDDPAERRRRGIEIAAGYTWERSGDAHMEAYRWARAAGSPGRGGPFGRGR